jgi:hypothetical protein
MRDRLSLLVVPFVALAATTPANALQLLANGKVAYIRHDPASGRATAFIRVAKNRALKTLIDPRCPTTSSLKLASNKQDSGEIPLPCANWHLSEAGYRYDDISGKDGPVRSILYHDTRLVIRVHSPGIDAITGPVGYFEFWLKLGNERLLARFHQFRRNDEIIIMSKKPTRTSSLGELAFWDTMWGDAPRADEAIALFERAVARRANDGRSWFLLGMMHLYRFGQEGGFTNASAFAKDEAAAASAALEMAMPLLPDDTRIPGFRAAATYVNGVAHQDAAQIALGLQQLTDAVPLNPLFNSFDFLGVVPPVVSPANPLMAQAVTLVDSALVPPNVNCLTDLPEVCANAGMAPHNTEGALLLFGDTYAKGGRLADAQSFYGLSNLLGATWPFHALAQDRVATAAQRVAAYQDADPANDPRIVGTGPEACVYCHKK